MPGLDLGQVSSNWKKLQGKLQTEKKEKKQQQQQQQQEESSTTTNGLKRKRAGEDRKTSISTNGIKKTKRLNSSASSTKTIRKPFRKMGFTTSKPAPPTTSDHSTLTTNHDISPSDLVSAYGSSSTNNSARTYLSLLTASTTDTPNTGLHPTHKAGKYLSLDSEMVGTGEPPLYAENILARVSIVNYHGEQIYDSHVLPPPNLKVKDYRTAYSGIRPGDLLAENGARPFDAVRDDVAVLLAGRVLVGHALKNDLQVLQLKHPRRDIRDTARYAGFRRAHSAGKAPALRVLAERELGWRIQVGEHSSLEDARAAMALFRKERGGMEAEVGRLFGEKAVRGYNKKIHSGGGKGAGQEGRKGGVWREEEDDEDGLDGEDEEDEDDGGSDDDERGGQKTGGQAVKKKRKKKKRTKRK